jgi:hypothetical protein
MTLVISDEAALLLNEDTEEGREARALVDYVMKYGRHAGVGFQASRETANRFPHPQRQIARELLGGGVASRLPPPGPPFFRTFPAARTVIRLAAPAPTGNGS